MFLSYLQLSVASAQSDSTSNYEEKLEEGIEDFYQTKWDRAGNLFSELKEEKKTDPRAYFFYSMIPFWEYFFGGESEHAAKEFLERSELAIEVSEKQLKDNPSDTTMVLMLSGLYGYRSLVAASEKEYRTAVQSGMTGYKYTRQLLSVDSEDPRALLGKGIFYYMLGNVPKEARWVTNLAGMNGDKEKGLQLLEEAASSDSYVKNDARMILTYIYREEENYEQALGHIKSLKEEYQQNIIFHFNYAEILEQRNQIAEAREAYQAVIELENTSLQQLRKQSQSKVEQL